MVKQSFFGLPEQYGRRVTRANSRERDKNMRAKNEWGLGQGASTQAPTRFSHAVVFVFRTMEQANIFCLISTRLAFSNQSPKNELLNIESALHKGAVSENLNAI